MFSSTPSFTPNFSASKEKNRLLFLGDIHTDIGPVQLLAQSLPDLCKAGYNVLFIENTPKPKQGVLANYSTIDFLIMQCAFFIKRLTDLLILFPEATIPVVNERSDKQKQFIAKEAIEDELNESEFVLRLDAELKRDKDRLPYLQEKLKMLQLVKKIGIDVFCIDVEFSENENMKTRNDVMLKNISKNLTGKAQGIVFCGISHCMDVWEDRVFYKGMISSVLEKQNIEFQGCFCAYSNQKNSDVKESIEMFKLCSDYIVSQIKLAPVQDITPDKILENNVIFDGEPQKKEKYFIPTIFETNYDVQTKKYIEYLGGKVVGMMQYRGEDLMEVEMASFVLKKERREKCRVGRVKVVRLNKKGINALNAISPITTEDDVLSDGSEAHLITFPLPLITRDQIDRVASMKINQLSVKKPMGLKV